MAATRHRLFVSVAPGLEALLQSELGRLGFVAMKTQEGGIELTCDREGLWRLCRGSALAEGVRLRVGRSAEVRRFSELEAWVARQPLHAFFARAGALPRLRVSCQRSRLYHSDAVAERVVRVLRERLSLEESAEPSQLLHVRLERDRLQLSVDAAFEPLHRRGYRQHVGEAPLRETLAAALLEAAGYDGSTPLWDPFCGSGTIAIEAALRATGQLPGARRAFAFEAWPTHDHAAYAAFCATSIGAEGAPPHPIIGSDRDEKVLLAARANGERAGLDSAIEWRAGPLSALAEHIPRGAALVANPPYGHRLDRDDLRRTFAQLGEILRRRSDLGPVVLLEGSGGLLDASRLSWRVAARLRNRGLPVRVVALSR